MADFCIVTAHPDLLVYVDSLQRKNAEALAFYPRVVFEREAERGRIYLGLLNGQPCGYIYVGSTANGSLRCHQVCIQYDVRRRLYGAMLVARIEQDATAAGVSFVSLRCGFDLAANEFWRSLGYRCIKIVDGGVRRMRRINIWRKELSASLFIPDEVEPATGVIDASVWRKGKMPGITTQFARGHKMAAYRRLVRGKS